MQLNRHAGALDGFGHWTAGRCCGHSWVAEYSQNLWTLDVWICSQTVFLGLWIFGFSANTPFLDLWISGFLDFRIFGFLDFRIFGFYVLGFLISSSNFFTTQSNFLKTQSIFFRSKSKNGIWTTKTTMHAAHPKTAVLPF